MDHARPVPPAEHMNSIASAREPADPGDAAGMGETQRPAETREQAAAKPHSGLVETVRSQPVATGTLVACVLAGATAGYLYLPAEAFSPLRRVGGGAIAGGLSWLLVMVGRII